MQSGMPDYKEVEEQIKEALAQQDCKRLAGIAINLRDRLDVALLGEETLREHLRQAYIGMEALNDTLKFMPRRP